jgi:septation ring formation regulator EzrA
MQLRELLQYERNSVQDCLPDILKKFNPRVKIPKKISDLVRKIEQKFEKANSELKECVLRESLPEIEKESSVIGDYCTHIDLRLKNLNNPFAVSAKITNGVIYELEKFRCTKNESFTELTKWVHNIFGLETETFTEQSMRQSVKNVLKCRLQESRKGRNFVKDFLDETYHYPTFRKGDLDNVREACKNPSCVKQKLKAITCCHQIQNLNRKMQEDNKQIENELTSAYAESEKLAENLNKIIRDKQISDTDYQELNLKYNTVLRKLQKCDTRNMNKKIKSRDKRVEDIKHDLSEQRTQNSELNKRIENKDKEINELKNDKRKLQKKFHT